MEHVHLPFVLFLMVVIAAPIIHPIYLRRVRGLSQKSASQNLDLMAMAYIPLVGTLVAMLVS
jgi:hypothetical protein